MKKQSRTKKKEKKTENNEPWHPTDAKKYYKYSIGSYYSIITKGKCFLNEMKWKSKG